jgi:hypothetical protein
LRPEIIKLCNVAVENTGFAVEKLIVILSEAKDLYISVGASEMQEFLAGL